MCSILVVVVIKWSIIFSVFQKNQFIQTKVPAPLPPFFRIFVKAVRDEIVMF